MTSLTETAYQTRKVIVIFIVSIIGYFVLKGSINATKAILKVLMPPKPLAPTVAFGKLPKISFPSEEKQTNLVFKLETIEGALPSLQNQTKVYFMPTETNGLLNFDRAKQKAKLLGFRSEPEKISDTKYRWKSQDIQEKALEMDTVTNNFTIRYPYENDTTLANSADHPSGKQQITVAKAFLTKSDFLAPDLDNSNGEFVYYRFAPPNLLVTPYQYEADFILVNLFRSDLDGLKILPPKPKDSLISLLYSNKGLVKANYTYYPIETKNPATYPLKKINQAWEELQGGNGFIANLGDNKEGVITVRKATLAYYDDSEKQEFLQPIYVFEGDNDFIGYVAAIDSSWQQ